MEEMQGIDVPKVTEIRALTPEQEARMAPWADEWIKVGLSCEPADWETWEKGARACYEAAGVPWPNQVIRVSSPRLIAQAAPLAAWLYDNLPEFPAPDQIEEAIKAVPADYIKSNWHRHIGGNLWASWAAHESFFRKVCGLVLPDNLSERGAAYEMTARSAGWWWPHRKFVMVCDRPAVIHQEQVGARGWGSHRLHHPTGPAIQWRDGWGIYFWHGLRVPDEWITDPSSIDPSTVLKHESVELRRAAAEIVGWDRVLAQLPVQTVDIDPNPEIGTLLRVDLPDSPNAHFLRVQCGTGRTFVLSVPENMTTAKQANAWTYRLEADELNPEKRT